MASYMSSTNFRIMELEVGRNLLNITSNNTNPAYAKAGDKLTVHLTLDYLTMLEVLTF